MQETSPSQRERIDLRAQDTHTIPMGIPAHAGGDTFEAGVAPQGIEDRKNSVQVARTQDESPGRGIFPGRPKTVSSHP